MGYLVPFAWTGCPFMVGGRIGEVVSIKSPGGKEGRMVMAMDRGGHGSVNLTVPLKVNRPSVFGLLFI